MDFSDLWRSELLNAGPPSLYQLSSLKTRNLILISKLKEGRIQSQTQRLTLSPEADCSSEWKVNCTSWKQKFTTSPLSSQTLKDLEKPILPQFVIFKLSYLVGPSWGEIIGLSWTHTSCRSESKHKFWPEKCLLDYLLGETWRETEADLVHYFILKRLQAVVVVPDVSHGMM